MGVNVPDRDIVGPFTLGVTDVDPLTMAGVYATFGARGKFCEPRPVTTVLNANGKTIEDYPAKCQQLLRTDVADAVNDILRGVQEPGGFGYDAGLGLAQPSAGKTGTTTDNKAVWFDGYTPNLATAAMIAGANSKGHPMPLNGQTVGGVYIQGAHGSTTAGPMWGDAMKVIQDYLRTPTSPRPTRRPSPASPVDRPVGGRAWAPTRPQPSSARPASPRWSARRSTAATPRAPWRTSAPARARRRRPARP